MTTKVRLCQVLASDVSLVEESAADSIVLPNACNKTEGRMLGARKVISHESLIDEITRREVIIKFVEEEDEG